MSSKDIRTFLPMTESTFLILVSFAETNHGYRVMRDIEESTGGRVRIGPGTLYGALATLQQEGLIERVGEDLERRKNYRLTDFGRNVALAETARLEELARAARKALGLT